MSDPNLIGVLMSFQFYEELSGRPSTELVEQWRDQRNVAARFIAENTPAVDRWQDKDPDTPLAPWGCIHPSEGKQSPGYCDLCTCSSISGTELEGFCTMRQRFSK